LTRGSRRRAAARTGDPDAFLVEVAANAPHAGVERARLQFGMFRTRLSLAFAALVALVFVQAGFVYWGANRVNDYAQHSRLASDILSELLELSANKQRLRVWASQRLMNAEASVEVRDQLVTRIQSSAAKLKGLARRDHALWIEFSVREDTPIPPDVPKLVAVTDLLDQNITAVQSRLMRLTPMDHGAEFAAVWHELNEVFDMAGGRDLRELVNGAIERQRVVVPEARAATERGLDALRRQAIGMAVTMLAVAAALALHLNRRLKRPLDQLLIGTQALQAGELGHRMAIGSRDEFERVAESFNQMAAELQQHRKAADEARHRLEAAVQDRTAELRVAHDALQRVDQRRRQLFADLGHELRTPATAIRGEAEIALRGQDKPVEEYKQSLARIVGGVGQLTGVIDDLMLIARAEVDQLVMQPHELDLLVLLGEVAEQAEALGQPQGVRVLLEPGAAPQGRLPTELPVHADAERLRRAVMIVLDNAVRYSRPGGAVRLGWQVSPREVMLLVSDEGIGIDADELPLVFERFMRGRRARAYRADGTGIGLSIAQTIIAAHQGSIHIDSRVDHGTQVRMVLPLSPRALQALSEGLSA